MPRILFILMATFALTHASSEKAFADEALRNIQIQAPAFLDSKIHELLKSLAATKSGGELLKEIVASHHTVTLRQASDALVGAGRTIMELSANLNNGQGADITLEMHFGMPDAGSHEVNSCNGGHISYPLLINLAHELKHARDSVLGQVNGVTSEADAVNFENQIRAEFGYNVRRCLTKEDSQVFQVWFPSNPSR